MLRESSKLFAVNRGLFCPLIRIIISHCKDPYEPTCNVVRVLKVSQMLWTFGQCIYSKYSLYSKHESLRHEIPSVASISIPRMRRGTSRRICENGDCTAHDPSEGFTAVTKRPGIDFRNDSWKNTSCASCLLWRICWSLSGTFRNYSKLFGLPQLIYWSVFILKANGSDRHGWKEAHESRAQ